MVIISSFKSTAVSKKVNKVENNVLPLSVKHATLLAIETYSKYAKLMYNNTRKIYLTPLAGAIFNPNDIPAVAAELNKDVGETVEIVCVSCQSGSHYLDSSNVNVAAAATMCATRHMADQRAAEAIYHKTLKQYLTYQKEPNSVTIPKLMTLCTGGVPSGATYNDITASFKSLDIVSVRQAMKAAVVQIRSYTPILKSAAALSKTVGTTGESKKGHGREK